MSARIASCLAMTLVATTTGYAQEDFRVATKIYLGDGTDPISENLTLFSQGKIYDFLLTKPEEITVFDPQRERFVLLDTGRKTKTEIATNTLLQFVAQMQVRAQKSPDPLIRFAAGPEFAIKSDERLSKIVLSSDHMTYEVHGERLSGHDKDGQYRMFCDWYAKLNATRPGAMPPSARMQVNQELAKRDLIPREVKLTLPAAGGLFAKPTIYRSEHVVTWRILPQDQQRISRADDHQAQFVAVRFDQFRGLAKTESEKN